MDEAVRIAFEAGLRFTVARLIGYGSSDGSHG